MCIHGACIDNNTCFCANGYEGDICQIASQCNNHTVLCHNYVMSTPFQYTMSVMRIIVSMVQLV